MPSREIQQLIAGRERLREEHAAGAPGVSVVRALSDLTDDVVKQIWLKLDPPSGYALVAIGGYGRRELSPFSDIDLIVLHPKPQKVASAWKAFSYEMWDSGLELGHGVYSPKDSLRLATERFDVEASYYDARLILGDEALFNEWKGKARGRKGFVDRLREATEQRRAQCADVGADLEPQLKDGRGGLRDLSSIRWLGGDVALNGEADLLHRVRNQLHWMTGRRTDRLVMQMQREAAKVIDYPQGHWLSPEDELLRRIYAAGRKVARVLDERLGATLVAPAAEKFVEVFERSREWNPHTRKAFFDLLHSLAGGAEAFFTIPEGILLSAIPEWERVHCLPQRNVYHRYAVDIHSVEVTAMASGFVQSDDDLVRSVAIDSESDRSILLLAALFHDIGKGGPEHAARGEGLARAAVTRMGLEAREVDEVAWLVRNHLLLSETATRRDIGDEAVLVDLAEQLQDVRRLRILFLLSVADGIATGPAAWSKWKSTLVVRLFTSLYHMLEQGELVGTAVSQKAHEHLDALRSGLSRFSEEAVESHLATMPRAWLLSQPVEALLRQSELMLTVEPVEGVHVSAFPESQHGTWEVVVIAKDRPGLIEKVSGALALHGLNVVGAQIFTREDGLALEVFRVEEVGAEAHRFERVAQDAAKALKGQVSLDLRIAEKRREYAKKVSKGKQAPPKVVIDNLASDFYTVIEAHATDRIGLLYELTKTLSDLSLDIHLAKVETQAEDVVDVFYVRDLDGQKVADPAHLKEIELTLVHRLSQS